jgi:large subunit ribosomal protein L20
MPRTKGGFKTRQRRKKILKAAKGFWGGKHRLFRSATEAVDRARKYAYRDRRVRKREFRRLWIIRINAAARLNDMSYSNLMNGLNKAGVEINRKMLSELAATDQQAFARLAEIAKESLAV